MTTLRVMPDPDVVERQNQLVDLYNGWPGDDDPDDDPDFVDAARQIMGLPPAEDEQPRGSAAAKRARDLDFLGVTRAVGHDITPGHDRLHHYWTRGKGLARWHDWTSLYDNLVEEGVPPIKAKNFASRWFFERFGFYAGADLNRVMHGKPPRGHRVGPG